MCSRQNHVLDSKHFQKIEMMAVPRNMSIVLTLITSVPAPSGVEEEDGDRSSSCSSLSQHGRGLLAVHGLGASYEQLGS